MSYKGVYKIKNPKKYIGNATNIVWRSLWERSFMKKLDESSSVLKWASEELIIPYYDPTTNRYRRYFPDFYVKTATEEVIYEIKPYNQTLPPVKKKRGRAKAFNESAATYVVNQSKWEAAKKFCDEKGWTFKVITENELFPTNK